MLLLMMIKFGDKEFKAGDVLTIEEIANAAGLSQGAVQGLLDRYHVGGHKLSDEKSAEKVFSFEELGMVPRFATIMK